MNKDPKIAGKLHKKTILVTGGTGSFGHSVIEQLLACSPERIIVFSRDEKKQFDMRDLFQNPVLKFVIGDVRDEDAVDKVMPEVDYIFHAAALKQVPTCEFFPLEAVKTNILGTNNVIQAAVRHKVKSMVILTTDKAVYPINAMGMSKALMEKVMIASAKNNIDLENKSTRLSCVRYGNVLYSRGSVLPTFIQSIRQGKKLTMTHPEMTRFLLPLSEAVDLVFHALTSGEDGYIYTRKSPASTIETLAQAMCEIFDYKKGIEITGIRAGEKMHETLVSSEEMARAKESRKFYTIPPQSQGLDYNRYLTHGEKQQVKEIESFTSANAKRLDLDGTIKMLLQVPQIREELRAYKSSLNALPKTISSSKRLA